MKIEMYESKRGTNGYKLIAETIEEKLILGSFRNGAFGTDGTFKYEGYNCLDQDRADNLVSEVMFAHNKSLERRVKKK